MSEPFLKQALLFGAGNNGRGFIGVILSQAGYQVTFVDIAEPLVKLINQRQKYIVREVDAAGEREVAVDNVRALHSQDEPEIIAKICQANFIATAVGPEVLPVIAPVISRGLRQRCDRNIKSPLNIMACENLTDNSTVLRGQILDHLPVDYHQYVEILVGFPCCVVDTVVTSPGADDRGRDPLLVVAERDGLLTIDQRDVAGEPLAVNRVQLTDNFAAYVEQKIFTMNAAHAATAYLGYLKGYEFIHEALADPEIRRVVSGAVREASAALIKRHSLEPGRQEQYAGRVLRRFGNRALPDPIIRVAREPKRKLAPTDRLVKPAVLALKAGVRPICLATGIAAALLYNNPDDAQAMELAAELKDEGIDKVLENVCGLAAGERLADLVKEKISDISLWSPLAV